MLTKRFLPVLLAALLLSAASACTDAPDTETEADEAVVSGDGTLPDGAPLPPEEEEGEPEL